MNVTQVPECFLEANPTFHEKAEEDPNAAAPTESNSTSTTPEAKVQSSASESQEGGEAKPNGRLLRWHGWRRISHWFRRVKRVWDTVNLIHTVVEYAVEAAAV